MSSRPWRFSDGRATLEGMRRHKKPRVLVVEDEADLRFLIENHLNRKGFSAVGTGDADTALDLMGAEHFDVIVLDNHLPGTSGMDALPKMVSRGKAPVLMITGYVDKETHHDAILYGAKVFMVKPFELADLEAKVRGLLV